METNKFKAQTYLFNELHAWKGVRVDVSFNMFGSDLYLEATKDSGRSDTYIRQIKGDLSTMDVRDKAKQFAVDLINSNNW